MELTRVLEKQDAIWDKQAKIRARKIKVGYKTLKHFLNQGEP